MKPLRIAVVVGSIRQDSYSRRFAQALARLAPDDVKFDFIRIDDLPHYNQDHDGHDAPDMPAPDSDTARDSYALTATGQGTG